MITRLTFTGAPHGSEVGPISPGPSPLARRLRLASTTSADGGLCSGERQSTRCVDVECLLMSYLKRGSHLPIAFIGRLICIRCRESEKGENLGGVWATGEKARCLLPVHLAFKAFRIYPVTALLAGLELPGTSGWVR